MFNSVAYNKTSLEKFKCQMVITFSKVLLLIAKYKNIGDMNIITKTLRNLFLIVLGWLLQKKYELLIYIFILKSITAARASIAASFSYLSFLESVRDCITTVFYSLPSSSVYKFSQKGIRGRLRIKIVPIIIICSRERPFLGEVLRGERRGKSPHEVLRFMMLEWSLAGTEFR